MNQISYTQRICADRGRIDAFLKQARIGVLGMTDDIYPYAVPVNFIWNEDCIYIHGLGSGKKERILFGNPPVCFTVYEEQGTVTDPMPCHADTAYMSVMIFGHAEKVTDSIEAAAALQAIVDKYMPGYYNASLTSALIEKYRSSHDANGVSVYRIVPSEITAKENAVEPDRLLPVGKA